MCLWVCEVFPGSVLFLTRAVFSVCVTVPSVYVAGVWSMFVCVQGVSSMLAVLLPVCVCVCVCPSQGLVFSASVGVFEQVVYFVSPHVGW